MPVLSVWWLGGRAFERARRSRARPTGSSACAIVWRPACAAWRRPGPAGGRVSGGRARCRRRCRQPPGPRDLPAERREGLPAPLPGAHRHEVRVDGTARPRRARRDPARGRPGQRGDITLGYVGVQPSSYPINTIFLWTSGPHEGVLQVALRPGTPMSLDALQESLRTAFGAAFPEAQFSFEPGDIVSRIMNFSAPDADRGRGDGPRLRGQPRLRRQGARRAGDGAGAPRPAVRAGARLSRDSGRRRPAAGRPAGRDHGSGGPVVRGGHLVEPVRRAELLGRPAIGHRFPGAGADPAAADDDPRRPARRAGHGRRGSPHDARRRGADRARRRRRRVRPLQHAAHGDPHGEHLGRATSGRRGDRACSGARAVPASRRAASRSTVRGQIAPMDETLPNVRRPGSSSRWS